jgi:dTMP kinase
LSLFIVFEGGDGSGKTTQAKTLCEKLRKGKHPVVYTQEPGGTAFGRFLRGLVTLAQSGLIITPKEPSQLLLMAPPMGDHAVPEVVLGPSAARTELLYFLLSRSQLVTEVIQPHLFRGDIVICDRYAPSSVAYQGYGRGLDLQLIQMANNIATQGIQPNLIILLDIAPEKGLARKIGSEEGRFEHDELAFHERVREGYLKMAAADPQRWLVVDATLPKKRMAQIIWERVKGLL